MIMQGIFRLPWTGNSFDNKPKVLDVPHFRAPESPSVTMVKPESRKRKRTDTIIDGPSPVDTKRIRVDTCRVGPSEATVGADEAPSGSLSQMQQTIEHHVNLEILYKHRELRLIEQELAKCQIALEQLRRCEAIPWPGTSGLSYDVSSGTGPALKPSSGMTQPSSPPPWGVTDGPYSRHYAKWLLPDPRFDSIDVSTAMLQRAESTASARSDGRSSRNSVSVAPVSARQRRASRDNWSGSVPLSEYSTSSAAPATMPARNRGGPLVIKRLSDNVPVKLVCCRCHRHDFSSVQGFLNHCRIAHKLDYKSHEAAAQECGQPLEPHEAHLAEQIHPAGPLHHSRQPIAAPTVSVPSVKSATVAPTPGIHWLNSTSASNRTWKKRPGPVGYPGQKPAGEVLEKPTSSSIAFQCEPFKPSSAAPFLSAHFEKHKIGGDLHALTASAKERPSIESDGENEDEDSNPNNSPVKVGTEKAGSRKGFRQPTAQRGFPQLTDFGSSRTSDSSRSQSLDNAELSPHTADGNPGLVSDHDDDVVSEPDEIAGPAGSSKPSPRLALERTCGEGEESMDIDVQVDDDTNEHGVLLRRRDMMINDRHN